MSNNNFKAKTFSDTFLYYKGSYEKSLFKFLVSSERVDKSEKSFDAIRYEISKQQVTHTLVKVLDSKNVVLMINESEEMPRAFKVFVGKDPKDNSTKAFIDVTGIISVKDGIYEYNRRHIIILVSYLISAMNSLIYSVKPGGITGNSSILKYGTMGFAKLFTYIIDYLRIGGVNNARSTSLYLSSMYFQVNILGKEINETTEYRAKSISELSNQEIARINFYISDIPNPYKDIDTFIKTLAKVLHVENEFTIDVFINKWILLFGSGTQFATEMYTSFSDMLINVYTGVNLNRQVTIEKIVSIEMLEFVKAVIKIGSDSI